MKIVVLCGDSLRHKYFAISLMTEFPNVKVIFEQKPKYNYSNFHIIEKQYFGDFVNTYNILLRENTKMVVNNVNESYDVLDKMNPDLIIVHGTSIIKDKIIDRFPNKIINLHAGLSPYYRGSGTNMFPFYNKELEYVGMTVHYLDKGIDSGNIILQGRPQFEINDDTHTIGCKNVKLGTDLIIAVIYKYLKDDKLPSKKQSLKKGKLYYKKDFTDEVQQQIIENIKNGIVEDYIKNPKKVKIIKW